SPSAQNHLRFLGRLRLLILGFFVLCFSLMIRAFSKIVSAVSMMPSITAISATFFPPFYNLIIYDYFTHVN
ncbi:hypothetical protein MOC38_20440, partial [Bacillus spizizenii]|nr:hypothetical protein [Bacillus spizizenii]